MVQPTPRCFGMPYHLVSRIPGLQVQQLCQITTPATAVATADKGTSRKWLFIHISQSLSVKCQSNFPNLHIKQRNAWMKQTGERVCVFDGVKAHTQPPRCHISKPDSLELLGFWFFSMRPQGLCTMRESQSEGTAECEVNLLLHFDTMLGLLGG